MSLNTTHEIRRIQNKIQAAVNAVLAAENMNCSMGSTRYAHNGLSADFTVKVVMTATAAGETIDVAKKNFEALAPMFGLAATDYGRRFFHKGQWWKITGIQPSRPKYPVDVIREFGNAGFKFPLETIKRYCAQPLKQAA